MLKKLSRSRRALARRLKTPICRECGQPMIAESSYIPGQPRRFRFACWTQGCHSGEWKTWAILKDSEVKPKQEGTCANNHEPTIKFFRS